MNRIDQHDRRDDQRPDEDAGHGYSGEYDLTGLTVRLTRHDADSGHWPTAAYDPGTHTLHVDAQNNVTSLVMAGIHAGRLLGKREGVDRPWGIRPEVANLLAPDTDRGPGSSARPGEPIPVLRLRCGVLVCGECGRSFKVDSVLALYRHLRTAHGIDTQARGPIVY